ncbi:MAG: tRNA uridine-5-carboxymethylaminomethyl(34) synthesis GTPase MnmE [Chloroflexota bacterium]|nr:tRNA uridine-5-carboxymethylaminomethyl(34) synthesis GTPase MnmE [Chloroflexota bacterium]
MDQDTIVAISTPIGEGGIGIVRLSGPDTYSIVQRIFRGKLTRNRSLCYGHIKNPDSQETIDEVLVSFMASPHTYTREDMSEINCHGGSAPLQQVLKLVLNHGARLANPGEFTLRAFLNGRIDLAQAEAVMDVIQAKTETSLVMAMKGLEGHLSAAVREIRNELLSVLAYITVKIDFPDDDIEEQEIFLPLINSRKLLCHLIAEADNGIIYRQGIQTAIVGRPNVGKSSLLNRLLRQERAIVTPIPGTTRDTIEEIVNIQGVPFVLVDTAGILDSTDPVESLGIERSRMAIEQSDIILFVIDVSSPIAEDDTSVLSMVDNRRTLLVANKCDLPQKAQPQNLAKQVVFTSALSGKGMSDLEHRMVEIALGGKVFATETLLVSNPRHKNAMERAADSLDQAISSAETSLPEELIAIDLSMAVSALGEITGETLQDDLLETIFNQFCIGK